MKINQQPLWTPIIFCTAALVGALTLLSVGWPHWIAYASIFAAGMWLEDFHTRWRQTNSAHASTPTLIPLPQHIPLPGQSVVWDLPLTPAPWTVEPHTPQRDLWTVRTSFGLVIGPIFGKRNAHAVAKAPATLPALEHIKAHADALSKDEIIRIATHAIG